MCVCGGEFVRERERADEAVDVIAIHNQYFYFVLERRGRTGGERGRGGSTNTIKNTSISELEREREPEKSGERVGSNVEH